MQHTSALPTEAAETYTAHSTAGPAVQSNEVYPPPCTTVPSISFAAASDKRYSLGIVNKYRRYLLLAWMAMPVFAFLAFTYGPHHPLTLFVFGVGFLLDRKAMSQVRGRVPTLQKFYHGNLLVKRLSLVWGFVLSALAVWLLTRGQRYGYQLQDYLPGILALIVGPIAVALAVHQVVVFRALGEDDA
jgi:hypothetical protein